MEIDIDISEVLQLVSGFEGAPRIIDEELYTAGVQSGVLMQTGSVVEAPSLTGNLRNRIGPPEVTNLSPGVRVLVRSNAPYSAPVHEGHGWIYPRKGKFLRFVVGGRVVFARRVRPVAANRYMVRGLQKAGPQIVQAFERAGSRIGARVLGNG